ncbi:MAG: chemotaxis protein CheW [Azoarcus sp.]|jgi:twitching motility protein PilI|nr:chemotaxis protein CheW [Azoarcus sp.]MDR1229525.1 chemotaxis protein CheW [Azoarcus sp.]
MSKRISLRQFQENLARRLAESRTSERRGLLGVLAGNEHCLLSLPDTGEIMTPPALAPVPLTHEWYRGLVNVRGVLYSVVDLSRFHDGPATPSPGAQSRLLLVGAKQSIHSAILVSRVLGLRNEEDFELDAAQADPRPWVSGHLRDANDQLWLRLDVSQLLGNSVFLDAGLGWGHGIVPSNILNQRSANQ